MSWNSKILPGTKAPATASLEMQVAEVAWEEAWGSILNLHIEIIFRSFFTFFARGSLLPCLTVSILPKMFPKRVTDAKCCWWNKLEGNLLTYSRARSSKRHQDVQCCLWSSSVCTLCFITTFDCLNGWKDLHALRYVLSYSQRNRCLANKILGKIICFDWGKLELTCS